MAAPYKKKSSILEMSDREREARRQQEIRRPGRDAVERIAPEFSVLMPVRGAAKVLRQSLSRRQAETAEAIKGIKMPPKRSGDLKSEYERFMDEAYLRGLSKTELKKIRQETNKKALEREREEFNKAAKQKFVKDVDAAISRGATALGVEAASKMKKDDRNAAYNKGGVVKKRK